MSVQIRPRRMVVAFLIVHAATNAAVAQTGAASSSNAAGAGAEPANVLHVADLGSCALVSGESVRHCRIAYRTFGALNAARYNAVLIPSWYGGTSEQLLRLLGDGHVGAVDTTRHFAILVDVLGNGVSTSPSNSTQSAFPVLTIADMVVAQHRLVSEQLGLPALHAVVGFSMGAMQALEWAVRFPDEVQRIVSLLGTPRFAAHDAVTFRTLRNLVDLAERSGASRDSAWVPVAEFWHVIRATPGRVNELSIERLDEGLSAQAAYWRDFDIRDNRLQLEAMLRHDIAAGFDGDLTRAAAAVSANLLIIVSPDDRIVGPQPALSFGELVGAEVMSVPSPCGHFALYCEAAITERVRSFLAAETSAR